MFMHFYSNTPNTYENVPRCLPFFLTYLTYSYHDIEVGWGWGVGGVRKLLIHM